MQRLSLCFLPDLINFVVFISMLKMCNIKAFIMRGHLKLFFLMNSQVAVQNVTIIAPLDSPNTDGIDPGGFYLPVLLSIILHMIVNRQVFKLKS